MQTVINLHFTLNTHTAHRCSYKSVNINSPHVFVTLVYHFHMCHAEPILTDTLPYQAGEIYPTSGNVNGGINTYLIIRPVITMYETQSI